MLKSTLRFQSTSKFDCNCLMFNLLQAIAEIHIFNSACVNLVLPPQILPGRLVHLHTTNG